MKKIILSLLMLCTMVSAWSQTTYTTQTVTKTSSQSSSGKYNCDEFMIVGYLDGDKYWTKGLAVYGINAGCVITSVEFVMQSGTIDQCEYANWKFDASTGKWAQDGTFAYCQTIPFSSSGDCQIRSVTITYHKHTFTHNEGMAATCTATGMTESWTCSDCGHTYYDNAGASEVAKAGDLVQSVDPANHSGALVEHARVEATCIKEGNVQYWQCDACNHCFSDATGQTQIASDNVTVEIDPTNHNGKLKEVAFKNASVVEDGVLHHWHCQACNNDYADADATQDMNGNTAKARYDADALLIGNTTVDESYLFDGAKVTFDGDKVNLTIGSDKHAYDLSETERLMINFSHTFTLTANQDLNNTENYYSTFFTTEGAYKVPDEAKAYIGEVSGEVLDLTDVGDIIHADEPVILKATGSDITLMPSCNKDAASAGNKLSGTEEGIASAPANVYALSFGQNGVGFYEWSGRAIGANKAYLMLGSSLSAPIRSFGMMFDDGTFTGIPAVKVSDQPQNGVIYNLQGQRGDGSYKGVVIKNGQKVYNF